MQHLRAMWEQRRLVRGDHNLLAVEADGELAGRIDFFEKAWGRPDTSTCREIAVENAAELAAVKKVGFQEEGRIRRAQWRGGRWHDQVLLSVLRDEWGR